MHSFKCKFYYAETKFDFWKCEFENSRKKVEISTSLLLEICMGRVKRINNYSTWITAVLELTICFHTFFYSLEIICVTLSAGLCYHGYGLHHILLPTPILSLKEKIFGCPPQHKFWRYEVTSNFWRSATSCLQNLCSTFSNSWRDKFILNIKGFAYYTQKLQCKTLKSEVLDRFKTRIIQIS